LLVKANGKVMLGYLHGVMDLMNTCVLSTDDSCISSG
jgi:hypothetical protein